MKIRVTEIECNADELRQSNTLADSFSNLLRGVFMGRQGAYQEEEGGVVYPAQDSGADGGSGGTDR